MTYTSTLGFIGVRSITVKGKETKMNQLFYFLIGILVGIGIMVLSMFLTR